MDHQPGMHDDAVTLIRYVEEHGGTDDALVILEIILACTHPDFVMSPASDGLFACRSPRGRRRLYANCPA